MKDVRKWLVVDHYRKAVMGPYVITIARQVQRKAQFAHKLLVDVMSEAAFDADGGSLKEWPRMTLDELNTQNASIVARAARKLASRFTGPGGIA